ncbi:CDP-glycerol--glycerophosphate glycerophosphotransferase [Leptotrichia sp. OH3620_COT-345]|uniref:CDP-glycerol glycerophosphotransferase family protein n=1 Tax=Leptotrichia sp. OH3620_COT-345 TaxID=2491048 RepID=UPI000F64B577|nr:CDP-glycerol glycerophosphotransferase family protein [Leptotrichia sp. OH3620_COT-345]RRD38852.1 CDP-glycerol--glycerophosphate glycerophosphotransferase [Leptotrichia sp. OH3620_COT-345]
MDKIKCLINMMIAFLVYPFTKNKFKNRKIWLVGGNAGELYADNGRAMYEYLRSKNEIETFWIANIKSPVFNFIPGKKLVKGSVKAYLYFMNAEVVLFSHSISADIVPYLFVIPIINRFHYKPLKVFLNHGTVGFKVRMAMNRKTEKIAEELVRSYDINICDSEYEKIIKRDSWWNIDEEKIFVTGYPRYDKLYNTEIEKKEILFMPTWRNWIKAEKDKIEDTKYFKNIIGLITDEKLNDFLEKKEITLNLYIHQLMHNYLGNFGSIKLRENVNLLPKEAEITKELMKSEILITDYSSVAYDFYYLNKPVVFFQFDKKEYTEKVGSYVDLDKDLFGLGVYTIEKCVQKIIEISENDFRYDKETLKKSEELKEKFLKYTDKENCKRVFELILSKIGEKNDQR